MNFSTFKNSHCPRLADDDGLLFRFIIMSWDGERNCGVVFLARDSQHTANGSVFTFPNSIQCFVCVLRGRPKRPAHYSLFQFFKFSTSAHRRMPKQITPCTLLLCLPNFSVKNIRVKVKCLCQNVIASLHRKMVLFPLKFKMLPISNLRNRK